MAELEKLGPRYRIALRYFHSPSKRRKMLTKSRVARDPRFERLPCAHTGTYADDCLVQRITAHRCYIVATCDRELRRRYVVVAGKQTLAESASRESLAARDKRASATLTENGVEEDVLVVQKNRTPARPWRLSVDPLRALIDTCIAGVGYLL